MKNFKKVIAMGISFAIAAIMSVSAMAAGTGNAADPYTEAYVDGAVVVDAIKDALPEMDASSQYTVVVVPVGEEITDSNIYYINQAAGNDAVWAATTTWGTPAVLTDGNYVVRIGDEAGNVEEIFFSIGSTSSDPVPVITFMNGTTTFATVDTVDGKATLPTTAPNYEDAYDFVGWVTGDGEEFTANTVVEADTTVYPMFESKFIIGDVNADGVVSVSDAGVITDRAIGGDTEFTDEENNTFVLGEAYGIVIWGDVNADGVVSVSDAGVITDRAIGGDTEFTDEDGNVFILGEYVVIINK